MKNETQSNNPTDDIAKLIKAGDLITAYDLAAQSLETQPDNIALQHQAVLCLANAGALGAAGDLFQSLGMGAQREHEDITALEARILKSKALSMPAGNDRQAALQQAAMKYSDAYSIRNGSYPGINLATLQLLIGERNSAQATALEIIETCVSAREPKSSEQAYYHYATLAEAHLLLEDRNNAGQYLDKAVNFDPSNYRARSTTIHQLKRIESYLQGDASWMHRFELPKALHFCGHMFSAHGPNRILKPEDIHSLETKVLNTIKQENIGFGYGSLAAGADIIIAESLISSAAELHVVLPLAPEDFLEHSVRPYGPDWIRRFEDCLSHARSLHVTSGNLESIDRPLLQHASQVAMGRCILRSRTLGSEALQLAVMSTSEVDQSSLTHHDAKFWEHTGHRQIALDISSAKLQTKEGNRDDTSSNDQAPARRLAAMLFCDVQGFSALKERQVQSFAKNVLAPLSLAYSQLGLNHLEINTWGDALFFAFESPQEAAKAALYLRDCFDRIDLSAWGLPSSLHLRIGGNYGPVFYDTDPFLDRPTVFGPNVTTAAKIEPIALPGTIYVSESFACVLTAQAEKDFICEYIGKSRLHKSSARARIYSLRYGTKD